MAATHLLMISDLPEDLHLGAHIASQNRLVFLTATDVSSVRRHLANHSRCICFWNADQESQYGPIAEVVPKYVRAARTFVITDDPIGSYPHLLKYPFFGHHIQRRFAPPAAEMYAAIMQAFGKDRITPPGLAELFPPKVKVRKIEIQRSSHKSAAIEAIHKTLQNHGVKGRMANLIAQSTDELILNAIFDAPVNKDGNVRLRHRESREADFVLEQNEFVTVEFASGENYMAVCVTDRFGSIDKLKLFKHLKPYFSDQAKGDGAGSASAGFGLNGILMSGMSLLILFKPGVSTECVLFFPITQSFKEFRESFRFFSIVAAD